MTQLMLNAKEQATLDMREELLKQGKRFISFIESLDDVMENICKREETKRECRKNNTAYLLSNWTINSKKDE